MDSTINISKKPRKFNSLKKRELEKLIKIWNSERLVLYHITAPNDNLEYFGIIRIYYQDESKNIISKCFRVSSSSTTNEIISTALVKLQIKSTNSFVLIETHDNGEYRKLESQDYPLEIQLGWCEDGREGKFFLYQENEFKNFLNENINNKIELTSSITYDSGTERKKSSSTNSSLKKNLKLPPFMLLTDSAFTRTISNRNKVIERQRQKMVNKKLVISKKNDMKTNQKNTIKTSTTIGTIKVFATSLFPDAPYKTIIVSNEDTTENVIKEALDKFSLSGMVANPSDCYMVVVVIKNAVNKQQNSHLKSFRRDTREYVLPNNAKPLIVYNELVNKCQTMMFQLRKNIKLTSIFPVEMELVDKIAPISKNEIQSLSIDNDDIYSKTRPKGYHVVLSLCSTTNNQSHQKDIPTTIVLEKDIAIFGSNKKLMKERIYLGQNPTKIIPLSHGGAVFPIHCIVSTLDNVLTIVPCVMDADVRINNERIYGKTIIHENSLLVIGQKYCYSIAIFHPHFVNPHSANTLNYNSITSISSVSNFNHHNNTNNFMKSENYSSYTNSDDIMKATSSINDTKIQTLLQSLSIERYPSLPLGLKYDISKNKRVIETCVTYVESKKCDYKLEPAFVIYLAFCALYERLEPIYADDQGLCHPNQSYQQFINNVTFAIHELFHKLKKSSDDIVKLVFWLSNTSQIYHLFTNDYFLQRTLPRILISTLDESIQEMSKNISWIIQQELDYMLPALFDVKHGLIFNDKEVNDLIYSDIDTDVHDYHDKTSFMIGTFLRVSRRNPTIHDIFLSLNAWIGLFYYMKLNISFTVQLFQKLFSYCNDWIVIRLCGTCNGNGSFSNNPVTHYVFDPTTTDIQTLSNTIEIKLTYMRVWAETQGLEEAFDDQFQTSYELIHLLHAIITKSKSNILEEIQLLNQSQVRSLLNLLLINPNNDVELLTTLLNYSTEIDFTTQETPPLNNNSNGNILIADDDYYSQKNENITVCIRNFIQPLIMEGIIVLVINNDPGCSWESRFQDNILQCHNINNRKLLENKTKKSSISEEKKSSLTTYDDYQVFTIYINKPQDQSLGMHIVSLQNEASINCGIFIKSIVKGLLADKSGKFNIGDQILSINDEKLHGLGVSDVVSKIKQHEPLLKFKIVKINPQNYDLSKALSEVNDDTFSQQTVRSSNATDSSEVFSFPDPPNDSLSNDDTNEVNVDNNKILNPDVFNPSFTNNEVNSPVPSPINNSLIDNKVLREEFVFDDGWVCLKTSITDSTNSATRSNSTI